MTVELGRKVSEGEALDEIVRIVEKVAKLVGPTYRFGYLSNEDLIQEGIYESLLAIDKGDYDVGRPLENFLHVHIHNRLYNYKRKHYKRLERPCKCCDPSVEDFRPCKKWLDWAARNDAKQNLMRPLDVAVVTESAVTGGEVSDMFVGAELREIIDRELPVSLRKDYLLLLEGKSISHRKREEVKNAVMEILRNNGYETEY